MTSVGPPTITYRIVHFPERRWFVPKYEVFMSVEGFRMIMVPDYVMHSAHFTKSGAERAIRRRSRKLDFKTIENSTMVHE